MMIPTNPSFDIAHLAHVEIYSDRFEDSLDFFTRVYGLKLSGQDSNSAYLRAWDDPGDRVKGIRRLLGELAKIAA